MQSNIFQVYRLTGKFYRHLLGKLPLQQTTKHTQTQTPPPPQPHRHTHKREQSTGRKRSPGLWVNTTGNDALDLFMYQNYRQL